MRHREVPEKGKAPAGPPGGGMSGMDYQARDTEVQELNAEGQALSLPLVLLMVGEDDGWMGCDAIGFSYSFATMFDIMNPRR